MGCWMRSRLRITDRDGIYFITSTIVEWIPVFTGCEYYRILIDSIQFCRENKHLKLYAYVILENHFHMIVSGPDLSRAIQSLKRHSARMIIQTLEKQGKNWLINQLHLYKKEYKKESIHQLWQEGFYPVLIRNKKMLHRILTYVHHNPVKKGYVNRPEHWKYSSARNHILGDHSIMTVDKLPVLRDTRITPP